MMSSPYTRATYRYTPLLAVLLAPNQWLHPSFGKFLFAGCDILAGVLMYNLLVSVILPRSPSPRTPSSSTPRAPETTSEKPVPGDEDLRRKATFLVSLHLLSPLVFTISTRGSSESVLSLFVLATLYCAYSARWDAAAILLGLSTHWKIYPFVYGVACLGVIGGGGAGMWGRLVTWRGVRFACVSAGTFALLGAVMYAM